jgi:hypothetical protein
MKAYTSLMSIAAVTFVMSASANSFAQTAASKTTAAPTSNAMTFGTTPDDHARLREIFGDDHSAQKLNRARFSLTPGSVVPGSVHLVPLPQTIINIQPTWQGSDYFRVGYKVVIVDPQSKKIEGVLTL